MALYQEENGIISPLSGVSQENIKEAIRVMESMDDSQIIQGMTTGVGTDVLFYRFPIKSGEGAAKEVIGISVEGGYEIANGVRNIQALNDWKVDKDSDPDYIYVVMRVLNTGNNNILLGVGRQCKFIVAKGNLPDHSRIDEHAFVKAFSKAQRNGILHHADQRMLAQLIETWSKGGKGRLIAPSVSTGVEAPKVTTPPRPVQQPAPVQPPRPVVQPTSTVPPAPASVPVVQPAGNVPPAVTDAIVVAKAAEEEMTKLRVQVHNKFKTELNIGQEKRAEIISQTFADRNPIPTSLTELTINDLRKMLSVAEDMIAGKTTGGKVPVPAPVQEQAPAPIVPAQTQVANPLGFTSPEEQKNMRDELYAKLTKPDMMALSKDEAVKFLAKYGNYTKSTDVPKDILQRMLNDANATIEAKSKTADF